MFFNIFTEKTILNRLVLWVQVKTDYQRKGEILSFYLTKGNIDDRNLKMITNMTKEIFGKLFEDKGYISKLLSDILFGNEIQLIRKQEKI